MLEASASRVGSKVREAFTVARQVGPRSIAQEVRRYAWSEEMTLRFRCPLPAVPDPALLRGRQVTYAEAVEALLDGIDDCTASERRVRLRRVRLAEANIGIAWLMEQQGRPAHISWYFRPDQNDQIRSFFGGLFAPIEADEMLAEGVYVFPEFRGHALASGITVQHNVRNLSDNATALIGHVPATSYRSIRNVTKNGFSPVAKVVASWRLGRRSISTIPWDEAVDDIAVYTRRSTTD